MTLGEVIDLEGGTLTIGNDGVSRLTGADIGLNNYAIWNADYRPILNGKIVDHYLNREIGMETVSMFRLAMRRKMNEIMPYFNLLYGTTQLNYDPLKTIDIETIGNTDTTQTADTTASNDTTSDSNSKSRSVASETPQTMLAGDQDYATSASDVNGDTTTTAHAAEDTTSNVDTTSNATNHVSGYQGVPAALVMQYRDSLLNIDMMIITQLEELFMLVWDTGETLTY